VLVWFISDAVLLCVDHNVFHEDQFVPAGQSATIKCHAPNSMPITWDFQDALEKKIHNIYDRQNVLSGYEDRCTVDDSKHDLTIREAKHTDTGEYWCIESEGIWTRHVTKLYVQLSLSVNFYHHCFDNFAVTNLLHIWSIIGHIFV